MSSIKICKNGKDRPLMIRRDLILDRSISANSRVLYMDIALEIDLHGFCDKTNSFFADLFSRSQRSVSSWLRELKNADYIQIRYENGARIITFGQRSPA